MCPRGHTSLRFASVLLSMDTATTRRSLGPTTTNIPGSATNAWRSVGPTAIGVRLVAPTPTTTAIAEGSTAAAGVPTVTTGVGIYGGTTPTPANKHNDHDDRHYARSSSSGARLISLGPIPSDREARAT